MKSHKYLYLLVSSLLTIVGCTSNEPYRKNLPDPLGISLRRPATSPVINSTNAFTIETNANYKLGFVEFDDQGWFWSHQQWKAVKDEIDMEASNNSYGLVIVVFVHGWKNNAAYDNGNVEMFRGVLNDMSKTVSAEDAISKYPPRKVFGVYLGWRGLATTSDLFPPLGMEASFYNRKDVAERIGHEGAATQVFTELEIMQDDFNERRTNGPPPTKLIIIGHSFGGALVFSAISQVLTERLVMAGRHKGQETVRSLGDLVILLNPAFEASLYNNLIALATSPDIQYPPDQRPVLAVFTSKTDAATKKWFPRGRRLSTFFEKTREKNDVWLFNTPKHPAPDQKTAILRTIGNDQEFLTYDLTYTNYSSAHPSSMKGAVTPHEHIQNIHRLQTLWTANSLQTNAAEMVSYTFDNFNGTNHYAYILVPRKNVRPGNPFLNVSVDKRIMDGHSDITNRNLIKFLEDFIVFSQTNYSNTVTN